MTDERDNILSIANRVRGLRSVNAAPYDWVEFKRRSHERRSAPWHRTAIAASFVLALAGVAGWLRYSADDADVRFADTSFDEPVAAMSAGRPDEGGPVSMAGAVGSDAQTATVQWLASLPNEPVVARVGTRLPVVDLEDRIAWIDDLINTAQVESAQPAHIQTLRRERAQLISSLAQVRYAETLAAGR